MSMLNLFQKIYPYIAPHRGRIVAAIVLSFILAGLKATQAYLVKPIFDQGLSSSATLEDALWTAGLLMTVLLINFPCRFFHFYWIQFVVTRATCSVRSKMYEKLQKLPLSYFSDSKQGVLISNLLNDTITFSQGFRGILDLIREPLTAIFMLGLAFYRDWQLTLVMVVVSPLFIWIFNFSGKRVRSQQEVVQGEIGNMTHAVSEGVSAQKLTKAFGLQNFVFSRFGKAQEDFFQAQMKTSKIEELAHPLVELVGAFAFSGIIVFAHYRIQSGAMTTGDFVSFVTAMALFMDPIRKYSQANIKLNQAKAAGSRIFKLLNEPEEIDRGEIKLESFNESIEIRDLNFSYDENKEILKNVNLTIKKGSKVAFVGLSGSGKSTLINLLLGLYPVKGNSIIIDGISIEKIKLKDLRQLFSLVSQDIFLFNDSVAENLKVGEKYSLEDLNQALKVGYADQFVGLLPDGVETVIGDRGAKLSGGQCQRLTISRAFLRKSDILLFDEATSALDNESEKIVQKALDTISGEKTVIAVAHRLSTIQDFDQIYIFDEGEVIESGTHEELMSNAGPYFRLYELSKKS